MKKILFVLISMLFATSAFSETGFWVDSVGAKGSWHILVKQGNATLLSASYRMNQNSLSSPDNVALGVSFIESTGGSPQAAGYTTEATSAWGTKTIQLYVDSATTTTVTITISGKVTGFSTATGSGSATFNYSGTGGTVNFISKQEHGLISAPFSSDCRDSNAGDSVECGLAEPGLTVWKAGCTAWSCEG